MKSTISSVIAFIRKDYKRIIALAIVLVVASVKPVFGEPETLFIHNEALQQAATVEANSIPSTEKIVAVIKVTAYSARPEETDEDSNIMASGKEVYLGAIACPRRFPFGAKVKIGKKIYTCEDRMALRFDNSFGGSKDERFDILMSTYQEARQWGVRKIQAEIIYEA